MNIDDALDIYVPGNWTCPKCNYVLCSQTIFAQSGEIGCTSEQVTATTGEVCPNDGEPMRRVTWRERADENQKWGIDLIEQMMAATGAEHLPAALEAIKTRFQAKCVHCGEQLRRQSDGTWMDCETHTFCANPDEDADDFQRHEPVAVPPETPRPDLRAFITEKRDEAAKHVRQRLDAQHSWRSGTEADHKASHKLAERMHGRKMPYMNAAQREETASREERIGAKYQREADLYDAVIAALSVESVPPAPPTGQSLQSIVRSMRREAALWPKTERAQQTARLLNTFADEIEAAAPPTGWQEMATAPKGQKVLVWFTNDSGRNRVTTATFFDAGTLDMDDERDGGIDEDGKNADAGWFEDSEVADPAYFQMQNTPKGWMPLPSAPLAADLEKK